MIGLTYVRVVEFVECFVCRIKECDIPLVPRLTDGHTGQQLGSVQVPEHRHPHLLLPSSLVAHILEGRQRQQGRRRQGGGRRRSSSVLFL